MRLAEDCWRFTVHPEGLKRSKGQKVKRRPPNPIAVPFNSRVLLQWPPVRRESAE